MRNMNQGIMKHAPRAGLELRAAACALLTAIAQAQGEPGLYGPLAFAPAEAAASSGGGAGDDAQASTADLAKTLANPIGALISVPFQSNFDFGGGPTGDGFQYKLNLQPIIPFSLNDDWLLISRTILPFVYQENIVGTSSQTGLADTLQSFFLSPAKPTPGGWIWGAGPALLLPTATDDVLGAEQWGAGPTAVVLKQQKGWTYGALANHIWSFAGEDDRADVNATYLQPFVSFTTRKATTFTLNTESTYDWDNEQWTVPVNLMVQQLVKVGRQPVALTVGGRYYPDKPQDGPEWGLRFAVIFLFPK
jgi:hypothetical protein